MERDWVEVFVEAGWRVTDVRREGAEVDEDNIGGVDVAAGEGTVSGVGAEVEESEDAWLFIVEVVGEEEEVAEEEASVGATAEA